MSNDAILKYTEFGKQYLQFRDAGMKRAAAFASLQNMSDDRSLKTLERQIRSIDSTGTAVLATKVVGRGTALNELQWVLDQNENNQNFQLVPFQHVRH